MKVSKFGTFTTTLWPFIFFVGIGGVGFGIDIHSSYVHAGNWTFSTIEKLGWYLASFTVQGIFLGSLITSILIYFSHIKLVSSQNWGFIEKALLTTVLLFSFWTLMLQLNILRQGIAYSFLLLYMINRYNSPKTSAFYAALAVTSHFSVALPLVVSLLSRSHTVVHIVLAVSLGFLIHYTGLHSLKSNIETSLPYQELHYLMIIVALLVYFVKKNRELSGFYFPYLLILTAFDASQLQRLLVYVYPFLLIDFLSLYNSFSRKIVLTLLIPLSFSPTFILGQRMLY